MRKNHLVKKSYYNEKNPIIKIEIHNLDKESNENNKLL